MFSYEIEDFLEEGKEKGTPLDRVLNSSLNLDQIQTVSWS